MGKFAKEIVFGVLFFIVVVLIVGILFYEFIPSQMIPEASVYKQTAATTKLLQTISEEVQQEEKDDEKEVLKSYNITSDDLAVYGNQQEYVKGKNHPFFDYLSLDADQTLNTEKDLKSAVGDAITSSKSSSITNSSSSSSNSSSSSSSQSSANSTQYNSSSSTSTNYNSNYSSESASNNTSNESTSTTTSTTSSNTIINPNIDTRSLRDVSDNTEKSTK